MIPYVNIHTHRPKRDENVICLQNLFLEEYWKEPQTPFSIGLHPWDVEKMPIEEITLNLEKIIDHPLFKAVGETGLHKPNKTFYSKQLECFDIHLAFAERINKPVIIHCVKSWEDIIQISKKYNVKKVLHGYYGSLELTQTLLKSGYYFSIGSKILEEHSKLTESLQIIPLSNLFCETDSAAISISKIYERLSNLLKISESQLREIIFKNYHFVFGEEKLMEIKE